MTVNSDTALNALRFKTIDGLQIRHAISEKNNEGVSILQLSPWPGDGIQQEEER